MNERYPISGLKVIYDGKTYDKILYLDIHNTSEYSNYQVSFTSIENEKETLNVSCMLKDIEIITK